MVCMSYQIVPRNSLSRYCWMVDISKSLAECLEMGVIQLTTSCGRLYPFSSYCSNTSPRIWSYTSILKDNPIIPGPNIYIYTYIYTHIYIYIFVYFDMYIPPLLLFILPFPAVGCFTRQADLRTNSAGDDEHGSQHGARPEMKTSLGWLVACLLGWILGVYIGVHKGF